MKTLLYLCLLSICSLLNAQVTDGLVGDFPFTDGSLDDLIGTHNCVLSTIAGDNTYSLIEDRFGNTNSAINFQGAVFSAGSNSRDISNEVSISLWLKTTDTPDGIRYVITKYGYNLTDVPMCGYSLVFQNTVRFDSRDEHWQNNDYMVSNHSSTSVNEGNWHHIVGVTKANNAGLEIWVDGTKENSNEYQWSLTELNNTTQGLCIGGSEHANSTPTFKGAIDDIKIYNRALTSTEINLLFNAGNPTGIDESIFPPASFTITPNPSSGMVKINSQPILADKVEISVFNIVGVEVYQHIYEPGVPMNMDLSEHTSGLYTVRISSGNKQTTKRLILK